MANPTNTIFFIEKDDMPDDCFCNVTYAKFVCTEHPPNVDVNHTCITAGVNRIDYHGEDGMPTADMFLVKCLMNIVIFTPEMQSS